jgi:Xaa-Pro aminopeptidase
LYLIGSLDIIIVKEIKTTYNFGEKPYYGFETVTMVPMCRKLIDTKMLADSEKRYLNEYHKEVYEKTKRFFSAGSMALAWLERETKEL